MSALEISVASQLDLLNFAEVSSCLRAPLLPKTVTILSINHPTTAVLGSTWQVEQESGLDRRECKEASSTHSSLPHARSHLSGAIKPCVAHWSHHKRFPVSCCLTNLRKLCRIRFYSVSGKGSCKRKHNSSLTPLFKVVACVSLSSTIACFFCCLLAFFFYFIDFSKFNTGIFQKALGNFNKFYVTFLWHLKRTRFTSFKSAKDAHF